MKNKKIIVSITLAVVLIGVCIFAGVSIFKNDSFKDYIDTEQSYECEKIYDKNDISFNVYSFEDSILEEIENNVKFIKITNNNITAVKTLFDNYEKDIESITELKSEYDFIFDPSITIKPDDRYLYEKHNDGSYTIVYYDTYFETVFVFNYKD